MKLYRLQIVMMIVLLCLASGLVVAQDATMEPTPVTALAPDLETALVPCGDSVTGPCDLIATSMEDVVGVWAEYLINPANTTPDSRVYIRFNADGTFVIADSIENTAQPFAGLPSGTYRFEGTELIFDPILSAPAPCNGAGIFQAR